MKRNTRWYLSAAASGALTSFLDRVFYAGGSRLAGKPGAKVISCRRGGASAAFDQINKYFTINRMPVVASQYWNAVHGRVPEDVLRDEEGLQIMRTLGRQMAWLLLCIRAGTDTSDEFHSVEERIKGYLNTHKNKPRWRGEAVLGLFL